MCAPHCTTLPGGPLACGDVMMDPVITNQTLCKFFQSGLVKDLHTRTNLYPE